jgi:hypothetical protein
MDIFALLGEDARL